MDEERESNARRAREYWALRQNKAPLLYNVVCCVHVNVYVYVYVYAHSFVLLTSC